MFGLGVAFVVAWSGFWGGTVDGAKESKAALNAKALTVACEAYALHPKAGGQHPQKLDDLVKPAWGGPSIVRDGAKDLLDPWGRQYQYAVVADKAGTPTVYVWSERIVAGKWKVFGRKPPPKKS